jgi:hypothetical protein
VATLTNIECVLESPLAIFQPVSAPFIVTAPGCGGRSGRRTLVHPAPNAASYRKVTARLLARRRELQGQGQQLDRQVENVAARRQPFRFG